MLCLSEFRLSQGGPNDGSWLVAQNKIMKLGFLYAGFAFILTLIREAIKDMEDMEGDARYGSKTMPIAWGVPATKVYVAVWMISFIGAAGSHTGIYHPVSLVVANTLLYHFNYSAVGVYFFKIVQGNHSVTVSLFKRYH